MEDAKAALEEFNNTDIEGRSVRLEFCQSRDGGQAKSGTLLKSGFWENLRRWGLKLVLV